MALEVKPPPPKIAYRASSSTANLFQKTPGRMNHLEWQDAAVQRW